jgi:hypothetical protein
MVSSFPVIPRFVAPDTSFEEVGNEITFRPLRVVVPDVIVPVFALKVIVAVPLLAHAVTVEPDLVIVDVSDASNQ